MKKFATNEDPLELLKEREAIYQLLPNIMIEKNYSAYTIDPTTRYLASALKGLTPRRDVTSLYDNGIDPIQLQGAKKEQDVSLKEPTPTHVTSLATNNHDSASDNSEACISTKAQISVVLDNKTNTNNGMSLDYPW